MRTGKPISTISYNSEDFLHKKLDDLLNAYIIEFYSYIHHLPEDDEAGLKDHFHVYIIPNKLLDTVIFGSEFIEADPNHSKPLKSLPFQKSDFDNWYLYAIHDRDYLLSKDQERVYHYKFEDIISSDDQTLYFKMKSIDLLKLTPYASVSKAISDGLSWREFFKRGSIPPTQIFYYKEAWNTLINPSRGKTYRNGRKGHDENEFL